MRGERQIEEEAVCNRKDDLSFRSEMEWNNMLKWVFLVIYCPFSSLLKKPNTFAFGAQMNQRPGCMNNFLFVSRTFYFYFFLNPHLKSTKWLFCYGPQTKGIVLPDNILVFICYHYLFISLLTFSLILFFDCCLVLLFLSSDGSSGELCTVEYIDYFLWCFFFVHTFVIQLSGAQDPSVHHLCSDKYTQLKFFSFFFLQRLVQVCKTFFN